MTHEVPATELLLTYHDLTARWGVSLGALYVAAHRGYLPEPDYRIGNSPVWTEATIRLAERLNPHVRNYRRRMKQYVK